MYTYERIDVMQNCCLWIGGVKASDLDGIKDNFNITDVKGYFLGGRLADWLRAHGNDIEATKVDNIDKSGNTDKALEDIFTDKKEEQESDNKSGVYGGYSFLTVTPPFLKRDKGTVVLSANGSFHAPIQISDSSFEGSSAVSSFAGSFGSFGYKHRYEYEYGSRRITSFGSLNTGSFDITSFLSGSFSYDELCEGGSFTPRALMLFFSSEPLNRYGYGIHLI